MRGALGLHCLLRVQHEGKDFIVDLDQLQRILRGLLVHGCNRKDLVALRTGPYAQAQASRAYGARLPAMDSVVGHVVRGQNGLHPRKRLSPLSYRSYRTFAWGWGLLQDFYVEHAREIDIGGIFRLACQPLEGVHTFHSLADDLEFFCHHAPPLSLAAALKTDSMIFG